MSFISVEPDFGRYLALLYKGEAGDAMLVGIGADDLENQRRAFGTGSIIEELSNSESVRYAAIFNDNNILVATRDFPVNNIDGWYGGRKDAAGALAIRFKLVNSESSDLHNVFEVCYIRPHRTIL